MNKMLDIFEIEFYLVQNVIFASSMKYIISSCYFICNSILIDFRWNFLFTAFTTYVSTLILSEIWNRMMRFFIHFSIDCVLDIASNWQKLALPLDADAVGLAPLVVTKAQPRGCSLRQLHSSDWHLATGENITMLFVSPSNRKWLNWSLPVLDGPSQNSSFSISKCTLHVLPNAFVIRAHPGSV